MLSVTFDKFNASLLNKIKSFLPQNIVYHVFHKYIKQQNGFQIRIRSFLSTKSAY